MLLYLCQGKKYGKVCSGRSARIHSVVWDHTATFAVVRNRDARIKIHFYR